MTTLPETFLRPLTKSEAQSLSELVAAMPALLPDSPAPPAASLPMLRHSRPAPDQVGFTLKRVPEALVDLRDHLVGLGRQEVRICVLDGLPTTQAPAALLYAIGALMGETREYIGHGAPVVEVSDKGEMSQGRPSSDNNLHFDLHTDMSFYHEPPDYVGFLMIQQSEDGGETLFCDGRAVLGALSDGARAALQRPFVFPAPAHQPDTADQHFSILDVAPDGMVSLRYRRDGLRAQDPAQEAALVEFEDVLAAHSFELKLLPGQMAFYSNRTVLHGRRGYEDDPSAPRRSALRAYINAL